MKRSADDFQTAVRTRVESWFKENNLSPHANAEMIIKTVILMLTYLMLWGLILSNHFQGFSLIAIWSLFGIVQGLIGFNIAHDALHGSYTSSPTINRYLGYIYDWNGESSFVWKETHNGLHHTFTNISGHDGDIGKGGILRFSPHDVWYPFHRFQWLYTPLLYSMVSLPWVFWTDYTLMFKSFSEGRAPLKDLVVFLFLKSCNLFFMLILPLMILSAPVWQIFTGFLMMHLACGIVVALIFQLAHVVEGVDFPLPDEEGKIGDEWAAHEMKTTSNFAPNSPILSWFLGGLNYQVEHHLFPHICHVHYPKIAPIVRQTAHDYGLPYHEHLTFVKALSSHFRLLKQLGNPALNRRMT